MSTLPNNSKITTIPTTTSVLIISTDLSGLATDQHRRYTPPLQQHRRWIEVSMCLTPPSTGIQTILPYTQAIEKLAPHIQQFGVESNGKGVSIDGVYLHFETGETDFW